MTLSKLEIQQMLREMNVKFDADESYEALKQRLQQENHIAWLKSGAGDPNASGGSGSRIVKKRKRSPSLSSPAGVMSNGTPESLTETRLPAASPPVPPRRPHPEGPSDSIKKPDPGKPWKAVSEGTEPFNRKKNVFSLILRRAGMHCEGCGQPEDKTNPGSTLFPCYLQSPDQGGEHSIKNMVALCGVCREALTSGTLSKTEIKELHRKTRAKLYRPPEVTKKIVVQKRRPLSGH